MLLSNFNLAFLQHRNRKKIEIPRMTIYRDEEEKNKEYQNA